MRSGRLENLAAEVSHALRSLCLIVTPLVVGLACYGQPVVRDLFQRGRFTAGDTQAVALLLALYLVMVAAAAFSEVAAKVLYAMSDTTTPTLIGCLGSRWGWR